MLQKSFLAVACLSTRGAACLNIVLAVMHETIPNHCIGLRLMSAPQGLLTKTADLKIVFLDFEIC